MSGRSVFEILEEVSTVELLTELKRRYRVLQRPEGSVVILGAPGSGKHTQAKYVRAEFGLCGVDGARIKAESDNNTMETLKKISEKLQDARCRRGFVISGFPSTAEEVGPFEKMLQLDFPEKAIFSNYKVVELVGEDAKRLEERATTKDDFAPRLSSWIANKTALFSANTQFSRRQEVDASKSTEEVSKEIFDFLSKP